MFSQGNIYTQERRNKRAVLDITQPNKQFNESDTSPR